MPILKDKISPWNHMTDLAIGPSIGYFHRLDQYIVQARKTGSSKLHFGRIFFIAKQNNPIIHHHVSKSEYFLSGKAESPAQWMLKP